MLNLNRWSTNLYVGSNAATELSVLKRCVVVSIVLCSSCVTDLCRSENSHTDFVIVIDLPIQRGYGVIRTEALCVSVSPSYMSLCATLLLLIQYVRRRVAALRMNRTVLRTYDDVSTECVQSNEVKLC